MKKLFISLALIGAVALSTNGAFAWGCGCQKQEVLKTCPCMSKLNPLPLLGIGESPYKFSLNPFKGFKNCNKCQAASKCDTCTGAAAPVCPTCVKAFPDQPCNKCQKMIIPAPQIYVQEPQCPCMKKRY